MALRHRRDLVTEPGVIVVDGVYINGAVARLAEVVEVAEASGSVRCDGRLALRILRCASVACQASQGHSARAARREAQP